VEVAKPPIYRGKIEKVSAFINIAHLYLSIKMTEETKATKMAWVLFYIQEEVAEVWKDNLLDELSKGESGVEMVEELFKKIKNKFRETREEDRTVESNRTEG